MPVAGPSAVVVLGCGRRGGGARRIVKLGEGAPLDVLGDGGAFGVLLQLLEGRELAGGVGLAAGGAVQVVKLEMGGGEQRVQLRRALELGDGLRSAPEGDGPRRVGNGRWARSAQLDSRANWAAARSRSLDCLRKPR
jgi:hypothetical protein